VSDDKNRAGSAQCNLTLAAEIEHVIVCLAKKITYINTYINFLIFFPFFLSSS